MSEFTSFNRCLIELGDQQIYATAANLRMAPSLKRDVRFDGFSLNKVGATVNDPTLVPTGPLKGSLSFDFIISEDHFNPIHTIFDISNSMTESSIVMGRIGNYRFWNAYLTSFSFTMEPFQLIRAQAEYEIFGTIHEIGDKKLAEVPDVNPAESLKSYGEISATGIDLQDENNKFDLRMLSAEYSAKATRRTTYSIRMNEGPASSLSGTGLLPYRSAISNIEINCNIKSNKIINYINHEGVVQMQHPAEVPEEIAVQLNLYGAKKENVYTHVNDPTKKIDEATYLAMSAADQGMYTGPARESMHIASFGCSGKVMSQGLSVSTGGYLSGEFSVSQIVR